MSRRIIPRVYKPAIAIIGEGRTEKIYFDQLKKHENIAFTVKPELPDHPEIKSILDKAIDLIKKEGGQYEQVFCIFDLDVIKREDTTLHEYNRLKAKYNKGKITFIENNPCLEFWFLLHYKQTTRGFVSYRALERELRRYINDYQKSTRYFNAKNIYAHLKVHQGVAKQNAIHSITHSTETSSKSEMHKILAYLNI